MAEPGTSFLDRIRGLVSGRGVSPEQLAKDPDTVYMISREALDSMVLSRVISLYAEIVPGCDVEMARLLSGRLGQLQTSVGELKSGESSGITLDLGSKFSKGSRLCLAYSNSSVANHSGGFTAFFDVNVDFSEGNGAVKDEVKEIGGRFETAVSGYFWSTGKAVPLYRRETSVPQTPVTS